MAVTNLRRVWPKKVVEEGSMAALAFAVSRRFLGNLWLQIQSSRVLDRDIGTYIPRHITEFHKPNFISQESIIHQQSRIGDVVGKPHGEI